MAGSATSGLPQEEVHRSKQNMPWLITWADRQAQDLGIFGNGRGEVMVQGRAVSATVREILKPLSSSGNRVVDLVLPFQPHPDARVDEATYRLTPCRSAAGR